MFSEIYCSFILRIKIFEKIKKYLLQRNHSFINKFLMFIFVMITSSDFISQYLEIFPE